MLPCWWLWKWLTEQRKKIPSSLFEHLQDSSGCAGFELSRRTPPKSGDSKPLMTRYKINFLGSIPFSWKVSRQHFLLLVLSIRFLRIPQYVFLRLNSVVCLFLFLTSPSRGFNNKLELKWPRPELRKQKNAFAFFEAYPLCHCSCVCLFRIFPLVHLRVLLYLISVVSTTRNLDLLASNCE